MIKKNTNVKSVMKVGFSQEPIMTLALQSAQMEYQMNNSETVSQQAMIRCYRGITGTVWSEKTIPQQNARFVTRLKGTD